MEQKRREFVESLRHSWRKRLEYLRNVLVAQDAKTSTRTLDPDRRQLFDSIAFEFEGDLRYLGFVLTELDMKLVAKDEEIARLRRLTRISMRTSRRRGTHAK